MADEEPIWNTVNDLEGFAKAAGLNKSGLWVPGMDDTPREHPEPNPWGTTAASQQVPLTIDELQRMLDELPKAPLLSDGVRVVHFDAAKNPGSYSGHMIVADSPEQPAPAISQAELVKIQTALDAIAARGEKPMIVIGDQVAYIMPDMQGRGVMDRIISSLGIPASMFDNIDTNFSSHRETMRAYEAGLQDLQDKTIRRISAGLEKFLPEVQEPPAHVNCRCHCIMIPTPRHQRPLRLWSTHPRRYRGPKI